MLFLLLVAITALCALSIIFNLALLEQLDASRSELAASKLRCSAFERHSVRQHHARLAAEAQAFQALRALESVPLPQRFRWFGQTRGSA